MIESVYWKNELKAQARRIRAQMPCPRWTEKRVVLLEREIMVVCFCVRSLIERRKVTDAVAGTLLPVIAYPIRSGKKVNLLNRGDLDELYDLDAPTKRHVKLGFITNQVIHSYVMFVLRGTNRKRFDRVLVCSDYERNKQLFELEIEQLLIAIKSVATSYARRTEYNYDETIQDFRVRSD